MEYVKLFGFYIDTKLTWSSALEYLKKQLSLNLYLLRQLKNTVCPEMVGME